MDKELMRDQIGEFADILYFPLEAQRFAVSLFDGLARKREEILARRNIFNSLETHNRWQDFVAIEANRLALHIDPAYQPGAQSGNDKLTMIVRNRFYAMFVKTGVSSEKIRKARSAIEEMMVG